MPTMVAHRHRSANRFAPAARRGLPVVVVVIAAPIVGRRGSLVLTRTQEWVLWLIFIPFRKRARR